MATFLSIFRPDPTSVRALMALALAVLICEFALISPIVVASENRPAQQDSSETLTQLIQRLSSEGMAELTHLTSNYSPRQYFRDLYRKLPRRRAGVIVGLACLRWWEAAYLQGVDGVRTVVRLAVLARGLAAVVIHLILWHKATGFRPESDNPWAVLAPCPSSLVSYTHMIFGLPGFRAALGRNVPLELSEHLPSISLGHHEVAVSIPQWLYQCQA